MKSIVLEKALVWMTIMVFSLAFTGLCLAGIDPNSVVGLWLFDEDRNDTVPDVSENGNDGKLNGDPEFTDGRFGTALEYDGVDDFVEIPDIHERIKDGFTVTFWLNKTDQDLGNRWLFGSYSGWSTGSTSFLIWKAEQDNKNNLSFRIQGAGGSSPSCLYTELTFEEWNHIAATYDKSEMKLYVNGQNVASQAFAEEVSSSAEPWYIGYALGNQILGLMDEVAVFNVALTIDDIEEIMNEGLEAALGMTDVDFPGKLATTWGNIK